MRIRKAVPKDIKTFLKFKEYFTIPKTKEPSVEGFLMGSNEAAYLNFVENDIVLVLENEEKEIVGYSIVLCDSTLRNSSVWEKRKQISWESNFILELESQPISFFEQLAVLPNIRYRAYAKNLGLLSLAKAFEDHPFSLTTVVSSPILNLASRGFVLAAGYKPIGEIVEDYPNLSNVKSDFFVMTKKDFEYQMNGKYKSQFKKILKMH